MPVSLVTECKALSFPLAIVEDSYLYEVLGLFGMIKTAKEQSNYKHLRT